MLSDNPITKKYSPKVRSVDAPTNRSWSDKQKIEAVQSYVLLGNLALVSRVLSIPEITLRVWKTTEWWKNTVEDIKAAESVQLSARLKKIAEASLGVIEDRLTNGDFIYDQKTQSLARKPVNMKDAHKVAIDMMEKKNILEKSTVSEKQQQETDDSRLLKLAEKFAEIVHKRPPPVDVEVVEVVETKED